MDTIRVANTHPPFMGGGGVKVCCQSMLSGLSFYISRPYFELIFMYKIYTCIRTDRPFSCLFFFSYSLVITLQARSIVFEGEGGSLIKKAGQAKNKKGKKGQLNF